MLTRARIERARPDAIVVIVNGPVALGAVLFLQVVALSVYACIIREVATASGRLVEIMHAMHGMGTRP